MMLSKREQEIYTFIADNEPVIRKQVVKEFSWLAPKTIYENINKLLEKEKIFESKFKQLSASRFDTPSWQIPKHMNQYINFSNIANAFARDNKEFNNMAEEILQQYHRQIGILLGNLLVIANTKSRNPEYKLISREYKYTEPVDVHELTKDFADLVEILSLVKEPNVRIENEDSE